MHDPHGWHSLMPSAAASRRPCTPTGGVVTVVEVGAPSRADRQLRGVATSLARWFVLLGPVTVLVCPQLHSYAESTDGRHIFVLSLCLFLPTIKAPFSCSELAFSQPQAPPLHPLVICKRVIHRACASSFFSNCRRHLQPAAVPRLWLYKTNH